VKKDKRYISTDNIDRSHFAEGFVNFVSDFKRNKKMNLMMKYQSRLQRSLLREEELKVIIPDTQGTPMEITNPNPSAKVVIPDEHPASICRHPYPQGIPAAKALDPDICDGIQNLGHPEHHKIAVTDIKSEVEATQHLIPQETPVTQQKRKSGKAKQQKEPVEEAQIPPQIQVSLELGDTMRSGITGKYGPV
jgi:hypothetical protein